MQRNRSFRPSFKPRPNPNYYETFPNMNPTKSKYYVDPAAPPKIMPFGYVPIPPLIPIDSTATTTVNLSNSTLSYSKPSSAFELKRGQLYLPVYQNDVASREQLWRVLKGESKGDPTLVRTPYVDYGNLINDGDRLLNEIPSATPGAVSTMNTTTVYHQYEMQENLPKLEGGATATMPKTVDIVARREHRSLLGIPIIDQIDAVTTNIDLPVPQPPPFLPSFSDDEDILMNFPPPPSVPASNQLSTIRNELSDLSIIDTEQRRKNEQDEEKKLGEKNEYVWLYGQKSSWLK